MNKTIRKIGTSICTLLGVLIGCSSALAKEPLVFSYWTKASEPFVIRENETLSGGIIKDLGVLIAQKLNREASFWNLPNQRIEPYLIEEKVDFDCITNPAWKQQPEAYRWSPALFKGADVFLVRAGAENNIRTYGDLIGKTLGIYTGYVYHPEIMRLIENGDIATVKISDLEKGVYLLELERIDALIEFGVIVRHRMRQGKIPETKVIASYPADTFDLHCAYAAEFDLNEEQINRLFSEIVESGEMEEILSKYQ